MACKDHSNNTWASTNACDDHRMSDLTEFLKRIVAGTMPTLKASSASPTLKHRQWLSPITTAAMVDHHDEHGPSDAATNQHAQMCDVTRFELGEAHFD